MNVVANTERSQFPSLPEATKTILMSPHSKLKEKRLLMKREWRAASSNETSKLPKESLRNMDTLKAALDVMPKRKERVDDLIIRVAEIDLQTRCRIMKRTEKYLKMPS